MSRSPPDRECTGAPAPCLDHQPGLRMHGHTGYSGVKRRQPLRKHRANEPCEHVAGAAGCKRHDVMAIDVRGMA